MIAQLLYIIPVGVIFKTLVTEDEIVDATDVAFAVMFSVCWPLAAFIYIACSKETLDKFLDR